MKRFRAVTLLLTLAILIACFTVSAQAAAPNAIAPDIALDQALPFPTMNVPMKVIVREPEQFEEVPLYNQRDYPDTPYGKYGTISSHGCGIVSLSMIATYLTDEYHDPVELAEQFGSYNTDGGSLWILFKDSAKELGLNLIESDCPNGEWYDWDMVMDALANGQPVICLQKSGIFTGSGHFIVLTGLTEDGKIIVNDPNGYNWEKNKTMIDGYANGFTEAQIRASDVAYWIYEAKPIKATVHSYYFQNTPGQTLIAQ